MRRKNAAAPTNVCFGVRGQAAWDEVDRQVWAGCVETVVAFAWDGKQTGGAPKFDAFLIYVIGQFATPMQMD
ncbi:hypothetical protein [Tabrizicola sp. BL-A-41-H6]|uniref:hypothetical protein n=1 Tax=Tabrizicola sp. BL-A-41-H6 TaxID=3421107 RepID=UPI003D67E026